MIYQLADGRSIDTARDLNFEERNFLQKVFIYKRLAKDLAEFQRRWRTEGNPVWRGPATLESPGPAALIILDMEKKIGKTE